MDTNIVPLLLFLLCALMGHTKTEDTAKVFGPEEVCQWETFSAGCDAGHVLVVHAAKYGRMKLGRCVNRDFGYLGCGADVLRQVDAECSGRQSCELIVTKLHGGHNCPTDLTAYLDVSYSCEQVTQCEEAMCLTSDFLKIKSASGILSSFVTSDSKCGSPNCPWFLEAHPGQRFNFTLIDFSNVAALSQDAGAGSNFCHRYAKIEAKDEVPKDVTSCMRSPSDEREKHIYLSSSHVIKVSLYTPTIADNDVFFFIKYNVVSCPDLPPKEGTVMARHGDTLDVTCIHSDRAWHLTCSGTAWVGEVGSCNGGDTTDPYTGEEPPPKRAPFGMLIVIGLGVALGVMIGILLLVIVFMSMRRRRRAILLAKQRALFNDPCHTPPEFGTKDVNAHGGQTKVSLDGVVRYAPNHNYTATIQIKRPLPLPLEEQQTHIQNYPLLAHEGVDSSSCELCLMGAKDSHVYETTKQGIPLREWSRIRSVEELEKTKHDIPGQESRSTN